MGSPIVKKRIEQLLSRCIRNRNNGRVFQSLLHRDREKTFLDRLDSSEQLHWMLLSHTLFDHGGNSENPNTCRTWLTQ
jgi:hypothetical protein